MRNDELSNQSLDFAVSIINLVKELKAKHESVISNQIGRSGTSIGANIREAQYAHGTADFIAKLQIALKEANETGYWLELLYKTGYITEPSYKSLDSACTSIRIMLISSIKTAKDRRTKEKKDHYESD
jgi:four helix bundle protein